MTIRRTVPNIESDEPRRSRAFYADFLGMEVAMERDEIVTFASPDNRTAQVSVMRRGASRAPHPDVSVEVGDVDALSAKALASGIAIAYPLTDEPWGVRRFFAVDPDGTIVNILSHR